MKNAIVALLFVCAVLDAGEPRPNVLVIVSDDQGYADTGFQGCKDSVKNEDWGPGGANQKGAGPGAKAGKKKAGEGEK